MPKATLTLVSISVLLIVSQACAPPGIATPDPGSIDTAIAETVIAASTQTSEPEIPVTGPDTPTATQTISPSPEPPTPTATALILPSPIFTPTGAGSQIQVSIATNCRTGPGIPYDRVGALLVGETAEVVGRHANRDYWVIRNPDRDGICWLWGSYATVSGNPDALPIYTPPPSPTPLPTATPTLTPTPAATFTASYSGIESCAGTGWWVEFELRNTGGIDLRYLSLIVSDAVTGTVLPLDAGSFTNRNGCNETDTRNDLPVGSTRVISSPVFSYNPVGNSLFARITLCSGPGLNGTCRTEQVRFTP
jgi:hypothetical protein